MQADQAKEVVRYICATWRVEMTDDQADVWHETLADIAPAHARDAIRALRDVADIVPSHAEFARAVVEAKRRADARHEERQIGAPEKCDCDGGWVEGPPYAAGYSNTVSRCPRCSPAEKPLSEHDAKCTCFGCRYGARALAEARAGAPQSFIDAMNAKHGATLDLGDF